MGMNEGDNTDLNQMLQKVFESTNEDKNYNAIKGSLGLIPQIGSPLAEFFSTYITNPAQERLHNFLEVLVNDLKKLEIEREDFNIESLDSNQIFITMLIRSLETVRRNHHKEKILFLKNLLLNSVFIDSVDEDLKLLFLDLIDELKVSQFNLLFLANNFAGYNKKQIVLDDINKNKDLYSIFLKKLISLELISFEEFYSKMKYIYKRNHEIARSSVSQYYADRGEFELELLERKMASSENVDLLIDNLNAGQNFMTDLGNLFIKFVQSPLEDN